MPLTQQIKYQSPKGQIIIEGPADGNAIKALTMNERLTNFRTPEKQQLALVEISGLPMGMIYIARHEKEIVGYITFHEPDPFIRWSKHPNVVEMGGIEVSEDWRRCKIGVNLLKLGFANPVLENHIVITMEYCWHWDVNQTGLSVWDYQRMLTKLFGSVGLKKVPTDDPDILEHPANVLMARYGSNVSPEDKALFEAMAFESKLETIVG